MEKQLMRVGINVPVLNIKSQLDPRDVLNLLFGARHEFVYLPDFWPFQYMNGSGMGALGHLLNDNRKDWKQRVRVK